MHILAKAQKKRDYYYRSVKGRRLFELDLGPGGAGASSALSSEADQGFLDRMLAERQPEDFARAILEYRKVDSALADLVSGTVPAPAGQSEGGAR